MLQAAMVAIALAMLLHTTRPPSEASLWPYLLAAYGVLAATLPWLAGGVSKSELSFGYSAFLGIIFAAPIGLSSCFLWQTPYRLISIAFGVLAALWAVHFLASLAIRLRGR